MRFTTSIILAICAVTFLYAGQNYCFAQRKFFSDDDYIREALRFYLSEQKSNEIKELNREINQGKPFSYIKPKVTDEEVENFLTRNKGCCFIGPVGGDDLPYTDVWTNLTGRTARIVVVNGIDLTPRYQIAVSKCGRISND